jgi:hypothetical protein
VLLGTFVIGVPDEVDGWLIDCVRRVDSEGSEITTGVGLGFIVVSVTLVEVEGRLSGCDREPGL